MLPCSGRATRTEWIKSAVAWKVWKRRIFFRVEARCPSQHWIMLNLCLGISEIFRDYFKCIETRDLHLRFRVEHGPRMGTSHGKPWGVCQRNHWSSFFLFPLAVSNSPDADPKVLGDWYLGPVQPQHVGMFTKFHGDLTLRGGKVHVTASKNNG